MAAERATRVADSGSQSMDEDQRFRLSFEGGLGIPFTRGNRVEPLRNGDRIFPAMLEAISGSRETIDFLTFVYWTGDIATRFADALAERARAGVRVQVILDGFGAAPMDRKLLALMEEAGVEVAWFRPLLRWKPWEMDNRTHRKVMVCDGRVGFTGGVGVAAEWEGDAQDPEHWRETHFRIEGPAVRMLQGAFLDEWSECGKSVEDYVGSGVECAECPGEAAVQVVKTTATVNWSDITTLLQLVLLNASRRVRITTAYFVPGDRLVELLCETARRGVEIELLIPGPHTDKRVCQLAGRHHYETLFTAGVRILEYQRTMLHAKMLTVDDHLAVIGSANFNQRSMSKDDELALVVIDPELCATLDADFDDDRRYAEVMEPTRWRRRSLWQRLKERAVRVLHPQL